MSCPETPAPPSDRELRRKAAKALSAALQERVRRSILGHPEAARYYTTVRGGTRSDQLALERHPPTGMCARAVRLWALAACQLDPGDPLRHVSVAQAHLLERDVGAAESVLRGALARFEHDPARFVLWQNLGVVMALRGAPREALVAYRAAALSPGRVDRMVAGISLCIVGTKLRDLDAVVHGSQALESAEMPDASQRLRSAIVARRVRGAERFWCFDDDDVRYLAEAAPALGVSPDWRVA